MSAHVLVLSTLDTKADETGYLMARLAEHGVVADTVDLSLDTGGKMLDGAGKLRAMQDASLRAIDAIAAHKSAQVVLGLGGGTGGEIALTVMRSLPITFPKVLISTLPFDPRRAAADTSIILVPTLVDICGLNATLREVLENTAAMTAGLATTRQKGGSCIAEPSVGITALGVTERAARNLVSGLRGRGQETAVFHSNGYGGAAFARFADQGAFHTIVDLTPHEITRMHLAGAHVPMPTRFTAGPEVPRIVLPGAMNFIGLGERSVLDDAYLRRPHYEHSGYFTHVQVSEAEMVTITDALCQSLNAALGPAALVVPMGGFSHEDCPGGALENETLRALFLDRARGQLAPHVQVVTCDAHISDTATTDAILDTLDALKAPTGDPVHV
ncbi:Tm-1-like ATP-binding domain-containing protein [Pseudaestuariivita sp.]|uniref:Tm-1-like ATP-binding domain-containing protein n=1 Tax=Pseudaestuariivita sp. TaxID=2211669 RepID=UPI004058D3B0